MYKFQKSLGMHIHGVPARDLTAEEYETHKVLIKSQEELLNVVFYVQETVPASTEEPVKTKK